MLTLNQFLKQQFKGKSIPRDFKKMALEQHYSQSKEKIMFKGDMDLCHLLRSLKQEINVYIKEQNIIHVPKPEKKQQNILENAKAEKRKKFESWLDTCPIDWQTSRHPSSEIRTINFVVED